LTEEQIQKFGKLQESVAQFEASPPSKPNIIMRGIYAVIARIATMIAKVYVNIGEMLKAKKGGWYLNMGQAVFNQYYKSIGHLVHWDSPMAHIFHLVFKAGITTEELDKLEHHMAANQPREDKEEEGAFQPHPQEGRNAAGGPSRKPGNGNPRSG